MVKIIPQITIVMMAISSSLVIVYEQAKGKRTLGNAVGAVIGIAIEMYMLILGGFFKFWTP